MGTSKNCTYKIEAHTLWVMVDSISIWQLVCGGLSCIISMAQHSQLYDHTTSRLVIK